MPRYRIEFECEENEIDAVVADDRWEVKEVQPDVIGSKYVTSFHVEDPDTEQLVEMEIRKLDTGAMVGFDVSYLEQLGDDEHPFSPYDEDTIIVIPDDENVHCVDLVASQMGMDSTEEQQRQMDKFSPPEGRDDA